MTHHVALFRGINVGGHNRLPMAELRATFESLGHTDVSSIIQSGNVCFSSDEEPADIVASIRSAVVERFDVDVPVLLRTADEVEAAPAPADAAERIGDHSPDEFVVAGSEIHIRYPEGSARSRLTNELVDRRLETIATARNLPTCEKIAAVLREAR